MPRPSLPKPACSVARALEILGDRWTLLLVREILFGTRRFDDFAAHLGIARTVLTERLNRLVEADILLQTPLKPGGRRFGYDLAPKGQDLVPALLAVMQWGDRWLQSPETVPIRVIERTSGEELPAIQLRGRSGQLLAVDALDWAPGPGAGASEIAPLIAAYEAQRPVRARPVPSPRRAAAKTGAVRQRRVKPAAAA
ncbi:winged helix-turn-helix transcriptional regulator [Variovorax sp. 160MFSha2.1]|uniref:winged helix-turn-helix transcriptional regulator n=1 Tax=Variovorax sp. 160MFSha2.1 TaxID=3158367 RepID=UPI003AAB4A7F